MIKVGLPTALVYGLDWDEGEYKIKSNLYFEENLQEYVKIIARNNSEEFYKHFAEIRPDIIMTVGRDSKNEWEHINKHTSQSFIASKWCHYIKQPNSMFIANDVARYATFAACSSYSTTFKNEEQPYFSVFTGAYKTDAKRLMRSYLGMRNQTYQNWEWVVVDDSPEDHTETWENLQQIAKLDYRVRPHRILPVSGGNIGEVKNRAASLCNGKWLIEMDHDDMLLPELMEDCVKASKEYPDAGFIYTNPAEPYEDGEMRSYTKTHGERKDWYANPRNSFVWGYGGHRKTVHEGIEYIEHIYPAINPRTIRFNIGMPNHARIWRSDVYNKIGKHNRFISVADDYELIVRTFLETKMLHINKMLYLQYNNRNSTVDNNSKDINRKARLIRDYYDTAIHNRIIELGKEDWDWNEALGKATRLQDDFSTLKYFEEESVLNYTYN